jgi:transposase
VVVEEVAGWSVGQEVTCPKCGKRGKVGIDKFRAAGKTYFYWTVRHYENGGVRRCVIARANGSAPAAEKQVETPKVETQVPAGPKAAVAQEVTERRVEVEEGAGTEIDRVAWYIVKFVASWGSVRENPTLENFAFFSRRCREIAERVGVDASTAEAAVSSYVATKSEKAKAFANIAVKEVVKKVIAKVAGTEAAVQVPQTAPQPAVDVDEIRAVVREEVAKVVEAVRIPQAVETKVEVPREVVETIAAVRDQIAAMQREIEYIREQVRQRKGFGARVVAKGERRIEFKEGNMYWMIREVMKSGGEWTKEQIVDEIKRHFGKEVSGNSVSGRISELAAAGYIAGRREGRTWYWRWTGP